MVLILALQNGDKSLNSRIHLFKTKLANFSDQIDKDILRVINGSERPVSSREISLKIKRAWHSVNTRCLRLQLADRINGFVVGRMNLWQKK